MARKASGSRPVSCNSVGRALHRLDHERPAHVPCQPHLHARLNECLGDQEEVGGPRAREAGHRILEALGQPHDGPDGRQHVLGPGQVPRRGEGAARYRRHPGPDQGGGVGHRPHHHRLTAERGLEPRAGHAGHNGEDASHPGGPEGTAGSFGRVGLHRQHRTGDPLALRRPGCRPRGRPGRAVPGRPRPARRGARPPAPPRPRPPGRPTANGAGRRGGRLPSSRRRQ